ncbi:MAG: ABC transporter permease [Acidobacteriota bacterium]
MKLYRLLARAFPPAFRRRYEDELAETAAELLQSEHSHGPWRRLRAWVGLSVDAVTRGLAERRAERVAAAHPRPRLGRSMVSECRHAIRALAGRPIFSATIVGLLAITMGANTAVFSVVDAALLRPLPYANPERLVLLWESYARMHLTTMPWSDLDYLDVRAATSLESAAIFRPRRVVLTGRGDAVSLRASIVEGGLFGLLGIDAGQGRLFNEDDTRGHHDVALLSHASWQTRFGADPAIVGRSISIDYRPVTVIGVLPAGFSFPPPLTYNGQMIAVEPEVYLPYELKTDPDERGSHNAFVIGRLKPGITVQAAHAEVAAIGERVARAYPETNTDMRMSATSLHAQSVVSIRTMLFVLLAAVGGVLLIACASIANLILARGSGRGREMALRASLGASRASLVRQLLFENALLGVVGTGLGFLVAQWISTGLVTLNPIELPAMFQSAIDWRVLGFTAVLTIAAVFTFGLIPALQGSRTDLRVMLQSGPRTSGSPADRRTKAALAVLQVALALVLLVGSGLAIRSLARLWNLDPGFRPEHAAAVRITLPETRYQSEPSQRAFEDRIRLRVRQVPGVSRVSTSTLLPFATQIQHTGDYMVVGLPPRQVGDYLIATYQSTSPEYPASLSLRILEGRGFTDADAAGAPLVALVSESLALRHWPAGRASGHQLRLGDPDEPARTIIGVVSDVRMEGFAGRFAPSIYLPISQSPLADFWLIVTSPRPADQLSADVRAAIREIDPGVPVGALRALVDVMGDTIKTPRFATIILSAFAATALLIAAIGLYGVLAFDALERRRELGVRVALGATPASIRRLLVGRGVRIVAAGVMLGAAGAVASTPLLAGLFLEVPQADAVAFTAATALLAVTTLVATWLPARRATRTDPIDALRTQ